MLNQNNLPFSNSFLATLLIACFAFTAAQAQNVFLYRLDSVGFSPRQMTHWEYYPDGKAMKKTQRYTEGGTLSSNADELRVFSYFPNNLMEFDTESTLNEETGEWELNFRNEYEYDEEGNLVMDAQRLWNSDLMTWEENPVLANIKTYNDLGQVLTHETKTDFGEFGYITLKLRELTYSEEDLIAEELSTDFNFEDGTIAYQMKKTYTHLPSGDLVYIDAVRTETTEPFAISYQVEEDYENEILIERLTYEYTDGDYFLLKKETPIYSPLNIQEGVVNEKWVNGEWQLDRRTTPTFDGFGNIIDLEIVLFNTETQSEERYIYVSSEYNLNFLMEDCTAPFEMNDPSISPINRIESSYTVPYSNGIATDTLTIFYYYSDVFLSTVEKDATEDFIIYPNPATQDIRLAFSERVGPLTIRILDALGRKCYEGTVTQDQTIDVSNFNRGVYFCHIDYSNGSGITRFVVD